MARMNLTHPNSLVWSEHAQLLTPGMYRHYKGGVYEVIAIAHHSETLNELVVYTDYKNDFWVRPVGMFFDEVEWEGRKVQRFIKE